MAIPIAKEASALISERSDAFERTYGAQLGGRSVIVIGKTGAGKTSLVTLLATKDLSFLHGHGGATSGVGHTTRSETSIPGKSSIGGTPFWDCPGDDDNRGIAQEMSNAMLIQRVINASKEVKVLVMGTNANVMDDDKGEGLMTCADILARLFANHINLVKASISLCVSKTPSGTTEDHVKAQIGRVVEEQTQDGDPKRTLLEAIRSQPIHLFPRVEAGAVDLDVSQLCDGILAKINSMPYAAGVVAHLAPSPRCLTEIDQASARLRDDHVKESKAFANQFEAYVGAFAAQERSSKQALEEILSKLNSFISRENCLETIESCQEIARLCNASLELPPLKELAEALNVFTPFTKNPLTLQSSIESIKLAATNAKGEVEGALGRIRTREAEVEAAQAAARAEQERQRASQAQAAAQAQQAAIAHAQQAQAAAQAEHQRQQEARIAAEMAREQARMNQFLRERQMQFRNRLPRGGW
ncbi:MAG: hypothetical protein S4CHLAM2_04770 [Chlamydiales bacterium]|nr:hypothetical protein [Chlamydiales bacterium]